MDSELMTIRDLAERWGVGIEAAKVHVRRNKIAFIRVCSTGEERVDWRKVRFRVADVLRWEEESARVFDETDPKSKPAPAVVPSRYKYVKMR